MTAYSPPSAFVIHRIVLEPDQVVLEAGGHAADAVCPTCGTRSSQVHDRYVRQPLDEPWRGYVVRWRLCVRRFRCLEANCPRQTFAESFGPALGWRAQRTQACTTLLHAIATALGGEAGARLASHAHVPTSPDTLLRLLKREPDAAPLTVRVLGVDDFALRRRHTYGTLLVNLETREPIDLLEGREAEPLVNWLRQHPEVEIVVRDRANAYADGARQGAPQATQVADRFHLVQNAADALKEVLQHHRRQLDLAAGPSPLGMSEPPEPVASSHDDMTPSPPKPSTPSADAEVADSLSAGQQRRVARWHEVQRLKATGQSLRQIARETGLNRRTVTRLAAASAHRRERPPPAEPFGTPVSPVLQPFVGYLKERWDAGCRVIAQLYREVVERGYRGSRCMLYRAFAAWRVPKPPRASVVTDGKQVFRVRQLCLTPQVQLTEAQQQALSRLLATEPELATGHELLEQFRRLIAERDVPGLGRWLEAARASGLKPFVSLANGLTADRAAVDAALRLPWSNGVVEGHVHKLKLLKRQGYGRASFSLLRRRVVTA